MLELRTAITAIPLHCASRRGLIDAAGRGFGAAAVCIKRHDTLPVCVWREGVCVFSRFESEEAPGNQVRWPRRRVSVGGL